MNKIFAALFALQTILSPLPSWTPAAEDVEAIGCPVVTITQSARNLNDATVALQLLVKGGRVEYDERNELLTWSVVNSAITRNSFEEIKIDKKPGARFKRIDPVDAWVDAHAIMLVTNGGDASVYVTSELDNYLALMGWSEGGINT